MRAYLNKFLIPALHSKQGKEIINSNHEVDKDRHIAWRDFAEYNIKSSGSSNRNGEAEVNKINVMEKLSTIEAKLDELIHLMNDMRSN